MAQHTVKGAWFDKSGRRHDVKFQADTTDRGILKEMIQAQYPCDHTKAGNGVQINYVGGDEIAANERRRAFQERQESLRQDVTTAADYNQNSSGNDSGRDVVNYGPSSAEELTGVAGLVAILLVLAAIGWSLVTFGGFLTGPLAAFGAYKGLKKVTGKDKDDYNEVATGQSKSVGSILCLILILSSGIVGARWGSSSCSRSRCFRSTD